MRGPCHICLLIGVAWLTVAETSGQGYVLFDNYEPGFEINAPVFLADGVTGLHDPAYVAQIYVGLPEASRWSDLSAVAGLASFGKGDPSEAGYWDAGENRVTAIDGFDPGDQVVMAVMVWSTADGASLEEVVVKKPGSSVWFLGVFATVLGSAETPAPLVNLEIHCCSIPAGLLIPEPSSVLLAFAGLGAFAVSRRRHSIGDDQRR